jgi:hypothetical protein
LLLVTFDLDGVLQVHPFRRGVFPEVCGKVGETLVRRRGPEPETASKRVLQRIRAESRRPLLTGAYVDAYDWDDIILAVAKMVGSPARFDIEQLVIKDCTPEYISSYPYAASTYRICPLGAYDWRLSPRASIGIRIRKAFNSDLPGGIPRGSSRRLPISLYNPGPFPAPGCSGIRSA